MEEQKISKAVYDGDLKIGDSKIKAVVLEDGTRVLTRISVIKAIGRTGKAKGGRIYDKEFKVPVFLTAKNLSPFISNELLENSKPIIFKNKGVESIGYKAELLPQICGVFLDADDAGVISANQTHIVEKCKILLRGFATVGIIALVDEVTGYQEIRDRIALQKILDKYITGEYSKWTKTFPDEFYKRLFKLKKIPYPPGDAGKKPSYVGHWTNDVIYSRLAPGVLKKLKDKNPRQASGNRKRKYHQYLTKDYGHPELKELLSNVMFLMKASANWNIFYRALTRARPKYGETMELPMDIKGDN